MYANLKLQLWRSGLRQNHLARLLELDETTLSRVVNGFRKPGPELQAKIAAVLDIDQQWLFEETGLRVWRRNSPAHSGSHSKEDNTGCEEDFSV